MKRKFVALFTLTAFVLVSTSCTMWRTKPMETMAHKPAEGTEILSVVKASGELIRFSKSDPARLAGSAVVGMPTNVEPKPIDIAGPFSLIKKRPDGKIFEVVNGKGQVYSVQEVLKQSDGQMTVLGSAKMRVAIPLSEVKVIELKTTNVVLTLAVVGIPVLLIVLAQFAPLPFSR